jgi:hypothetical protein
LMWMEYSCALSTSTPAMLRCVLIEQLVASSASHMARVALPSLVSDMSIPGVRYVSECAHGNLDFVGPEDKHLAFMKAYSRCRRLIQADAAIYVGVAQTAPGISESASRPALPPPRVRMSPLRYAYAFVNDVQETGANESPCDGQHDRNTLQCRFIITFQRCTARGTHDVNDDSEESEESEDDTVDVTVNIDVPRYYVFRRCRQSMFVMSVEC